MLLLERILFKVDWSRLRDSSGSSGQVRLMQALTPRRLTARPAVIVHLSLQSTKPHYLVKSNKVCENSLNKKQ
ncbi:hypothetical protein E6W99_17025 [Metabacillus sediminilitoris]|uniref:Uncharacterized protein n=1 Tax=Metabacillus sediminilitoris TaxID=2567941 RepID=A0A4S4BYL2_9BACI|nr:hypothetical protein E6W99_17025 [Metabacillus sediminilitoris]